MATSDENWRVTTGRKDNKMGGILTKEEVDKAIEEIKEIEDERMNGPKSQTKCPDCGATVAVTQVENGRYKLIFIKHN